VGAEVRFWLRVLGVARQRRRWLALYTGLQLTTALLGLVPPLLVRAIVDKGLAPHNRHVLGELCLAMVGVTLLATATTVAGGFVTGRAIGGASVDLRVDLYGRAQRMPMAFFVMARRGDLVERIWSDPIAAPSVLSVMFGTMLTSIVSLVVLLGVIITLSWQLTLVCVLICASFIPVVRKIEPKLRGWSAEQIRLQSAAHSIMSEKLDVAGATVVRLYGDPQREVEDLSSSLRAIQRYAIPSQTVGNVFFAFASLVAAVVSGLVYLIGGVLATNDKLTVGTMLALATYVAQIFGPLFTIPMLPLTLASRRAVFERVFELMDHEVAVVREPEEPVVPVVPAVRRPAAVVGSVPVLGFERVWFRYPTASEVLLPSLRPEEPSAASGWVLQDVSLAVHPGQMLAIVGSSGAGKSTIAALAARLVDPVRGTIRWRGADVAGMEFTDYIGRVGVVTQETFLFHDTIRANIRYARPDASEHDLVEACRAAHIHAFITGLPDGYDTVVGEHGFRLSGGEKQRVGIARMILKDPELLILDEATAHLDVDSERIVQQALAEILTGRTSLVIAHRLSTIRRADHIIVVEQGRVTEEGTHQQLLTEQGRYHYLHTLANDQPLTDTTAGA
jgi:ATP-binding cassette subfamily B protein